MPTMPLMIATFAYLNAKRFEPDTFVIDVRVSFSIILRFGGRISVWSCEP